MTKRRILKAIAAVEVALVALDIWVLWQRRRDESWSELLTLATAFSVVGGVQIQMLDADTT